jgi:hypothetical protein
MELITPSISSIIWLVFITLALTLTLHLLYNFLIKKKTRFGWIYLGIIVFSFLILYLRGTYDRIKNRAIGELAPIALTLDCKQDDTMFFINCEMLINSVDEIDSLLENAPELQGVVFKIESTERTNDIKNRQGKPRVIKFSGRAYYEE